MVSCKVFWWHPIIKLSFRILLAELATTKKCCTLQMCNAGSVPGLIPCLGRNFDKGPFGGISWPQDPFPPSTIHNIGFRRGWHLGSFGERLWGLGVVLGVVFLEVLLKEYAFLQAWLVLGNAVLWSIILVLVACVKANEVSVPCLFWAHSISWVNADFRLPGFSTQWWEEKIAFLMSLCACVSIDSPTALPPARLPSPLLTKCRCRRSSWWRVAIGCGSLASQAFEPSAICLLVKHLICKTHQIGHGHLNQATPVASSTEQCRQPQKGPVFMAQVSMPKTIKKGSFEV